MTYQKAPDPAATTYAGLKAELAKALDQAGELRKQEEMSNIDVANKTQAVAIVGKNLDDYKKSGEKLSADYQQFLQQVADKKTCICSRLDAAVIGAIDDAVAAVAKAIDDVQTDLVEMLDPKLYGSSDVAQRRADREAKEMRKAFESLSVALMQAQIAKVQGYIKNASAITGTTRPEDAEAYAWLSLADDALHYQWLAGDDVVSVRFPFEVPADLAAYETALIAAFERMNQKDVVAIQAHVEFAKAKSDFDIDKKSLTSLRAGKDKSIVAAAIAAATTSTPAKSPNPAPTRESLRHAAAPR